jgi:phosphoenolpyruvate-protein phosphotransferase
VRVEREVGQDKAGILEAQALMLEDPTITERARDLITQQRMDALSALTQAGEEQAQQLAALPDPVWQARAADVRDAVQRAARHLAPGQLGETLPELLARTREAVIVVAHDLAPSDTAQMRQEQVLGICTVVGTATSHAAIFARALGIPAVAGLGQALLEAVAPGALLALDGNTGVVHIRPQPDVVRDFTARGAGQRADAQQAYDQAREEIERPGQTRDGALVPLLANVGSVAEAEAAARWGAEGIGLLRTEFLFAGRSTLPDEHEQAALYAGIVRALGRPRGPVVVRTLDAGNDKPLSALAEQVAQLPQEMNPALGIRGLRLQLAFPALLEAQLRGLVRAAAETSAELWVMLPMVATVEEVRQARQMLRAAEAALAREGVAVGRPLPLGIMVETPAAVLQSAALAGEAAFFSIGTNDLAQYVMASDRLHPRLSHLCDARQPAVLHAIAQVAGAARVAGRSVAVCGEIAGDPTMAGVLVGLGVEELSMAPAAIPRVKQALAGRTLEEWRALAARALAATTRAEVYGALGQSPPGDAATAAG